MNIFLIDRSTLVKSSRSRLLVSIVLQALQHESTNQGRQRGTGKERTSGVERSDRIM